MTTTTALSPTATGRTTSFTTSTLVVAKRAVLKYVRTPQLVVLGAVQGAMFLLIFRYVFGGAITSGGLKYVDFLVPGFITTGVLFSGAGAAAGVAEDVEQGFFDRLRSLPISRLSVPMGRALADTAALTWGLLVTVGIGFLVGFRLHNSLPEALLAFGLCIVFGFAWGWVFIVMGLMAGNAQAAQGMSLMVFPFTFVSAAYVPTASMPGWLQPVAEHQPITPMVNSVRLLTQGDAAERIIGHSAGGQVVIALLWAAGIVLVFAPIAVSRYRKG
ncbi:MAG: type transporter [Actinomycetia bacterium]|nr:type transporter [Actinomycetes bacterium]